MAPAEHLRTSLAALREDRTSGADMTRRSEELTVKTVYVIYEHWIQRLDRADTAERIIAKRRALCS